MSSQSIVSMRWLLALGNTGLFSLLLMGSYAFYFGPKEELKVDLPDPLEVFVAIPKVKVDPKEAREVREVFEYFPEPEVLPEPQEPLEEPKQKLVGPLESFEITSMIVKSGGVPMVSLVAKQMISSRLRSVSGYRSRTLAGHKRSSRPGKRRGYRASREVANCYVGDIFEACEITQINVREEFIEYRSGGTTFVLRKEKVDLDGLNTAEKKLGGLDKRQESVSDIVRKGLKRHSPRAKPTVIRKSTSSALKSAKKSKSVDSKSRRVKR